MKLYRDGSFHIQYFIGLDGNLQCYNTRNQRFYPSKRRVEVIEQLTLIHDKEVSVVNNKYCIVPTDLENV